MDDLNATNASGAPPAINSFYFYETEQFAVLWSLFTLIVLGNAAVLVTLLTGRRRKSRMNFFIVQLALADLSVGLISVLTDIVWRMTVAWNAGNAACKLIRFLQAVVTYSSTYVLVALSIDRYDAITHPMNFSGSWRRARLLVAGAWLLSAVFSVPIAVLYHERPVEGRLQCWIDFPQAWQWQVYMTLVALTLFALPAVIISACYTVIVSTIWSKGRHMAPPPPPYTDARAGGGRPHQLLHQQSHSRLSSGKSRDDEADGRRASSRGIIPKAKVKTVKMTFVIVFMFVVCWSPYIVFDLLQVYGQVPRTQANIAVASFIQSLAPLNSAANPVVYCLFSRSASKAIRKVPPFRWLRSLCCPKAAAPAASPGDAPAAAPASRPRQPPPHWTARRQTHRRYIGDGLPSPAIVSIV